MSTRCSFLFVIFLFAFVCPTLALADSAQVVRTDTSQVHVRKFDESTIEIYNNDKQFIYDRKNQDRIGFGEKFRNQIIHLLSRFLDNKIALMIWKIIPYLIILIGMIIIIMNFSNISLRGWFKRSRKAPATIHDYEVSEENIHEMDFDQLIQQAIDQAQYRIAIRYLYLKTLKQLTDRDLIEWRINKTNHEYIDELQDPEMKNDFSGLTRIFDYTWYGNFSIDGAAFHSMKQPFQRFTNQHYST